MSTRTDVLRWAHRVISRKGQPPHVLLEVGEDAGADAVQAAFHQIARTSHPDLHRHGLDAAELELVTSAYAAVAGAYQELRTRTVPALPRTATAPQVAPALPRTSTSRGVVPALAPEPSPPPANPEQAMSPKAVLYYRKAELCLQRRDFKGAILQLKLAISTDPLSTFLRTTLVEVEAQARR